MSGLALTYPMQKHLVVELQLSKKPSRTSSGEGEPRRSGCAVGGLRPTALRTECSTRHSRRDQVPHLSWTASAN